ncbi:hypothetical protein C8R46DRAFT_1036294 [Mycena filopes]|nr:hypothetical protein C8R46DRAFT_1036294 [Mycena filopes]
MKFTSLAALVPALLFMAPRGGECVKLFSGTGCQNELTEFIPSCNNNCIQFGFNSLFTFGSLIHGTDCHAFSDSACQNQIVDSGNHIVGTCANAPGANSFRPIFSRPNKVQPRFERDALRRYFCANRFH